MTGKYVVIEEGALAGVEPTKTYYEDENAALAYAAPRAALFSKVELLQVLKRATTQLVPQTTVEDA